MALLLFDTSIYGQRLRDRLSQLGVSCGLVRDEAHLRTIEPWNLDAVVLHGTASDGRTGSAVEALGVELERVARLRASAYTGPLVVLTCDPSRFTAAVLAAGADDCMASSVDPTELLARLEAISRRVGHLRFGPLRIAPVEGVAWINGKDLGLQHTDMALLLQLAWARGAPLDARTLGLRVWGSAETGRNLIEVAIWRLRAKLGGCEWLVETVRGRGYRLRTEPRRLGGASPHRRDACSPRKPKLSPRKDGRPRISIL